MANLTEQVNALCMALQGTGLQVIPVDKKKKPLAKQWQSRSFSPEDILDFNPESLGIRMGANGFETVDVDSKNAQDEKAFLNEFKEKLQNSDLPLSKFVFQKTESGGVHLVYRTGQLTKNKKIARGKNNETLIEIISKGAYIKVYDNLRFENLSSLVPLSEEEYHSLISLCYSFDLYQSTTGSSFKEYNQTVTCSELLLSKGWTCVGTDKVGELWLRDGESSQSFSAKIFPNNRCYVYSTSTPLPTGTPLSPVDITVHYDYEGNLSAFGKDLNHSIPTKQEISKTTSRFRVQPLNVILEKNKDVAPAKRLFGEFWHEGELCVLFGQTNSGKSILSLQIALGLTGVENNSEHFGVDKVTKRILYFDLEMSEKQVARRLKGVKQLGCTILRVDFNPEYLYDSTTQNSAFDEIEALIIENDIQTVIFDNLSVLQPNNERAAEATELLNKLNALKRKHGINLLAIGHTPKLLAGKALEITDLQGSAQMGNLIDSAFVIGKTSKSDYRYLKQVKVREKEFRYDSENVLLMRISNEDNWLKFIPTKQVAEYELISIHNSNDSLAERDKEIYKQYLQGIPREQIERTFNISKSRFYEIIKAQKQSSPLEDVD